MKKIKQVIFLLTWFAVFFIAGNLDSGEMSLKAAGIAMAVNFIVMAWSGFSSGLLKGIDKRIERIDFMRNQEYCYSIDGEFYHIMDNVKTEDEAYKYAQEFMKDDDYDKIWIGVTVPVHIDNVIPYGLGEDMIERISDVACDEYGEYAEDYLTSVPKEAEEELNEALNKVVKDWLIKNNLEPSFFLVEGSREVYKNE